MRFGAFATASLAVQKARMSDSEIFAPVRGTTNATTSSP
jgi:hypothetical protein